MIIWLIIWWLFGDYLISNNHQIIQIIDILFDDYLSYLMIIWLIIWLIIWWLFVWVLDYLMIIWLIIWWLFFLKSWLFDDYLMIILIIWLFDDYSDYSDYLMIICHLFRLISVLIPQPLPSRYHAGPAYIVGYKLSATWRQVEARRRWRGRYWVVNRTLLRRLPLRRFCCGRTICLIPGHERRPAIRRNPPLLLVAEGLLWKLPAKMRKWSARDLKIVCRIHAFPQALSTTSRKDAWGALFTTLHWARRRTP